MSSSRAFTPMGALVGVAGWTITYAAVNMTAERYSNAVLRLPWGEKVPAVPPAPPIARATPRESNSLEASGRPDASGSGTWVQQRPAGTAESGGSGHVDVAVPTEPPQGVATRARAWHHVAGCVGASALFGRSLSQSGGTVRGLGLGFALGLLSAPLYTYTHVSKGEPTLLQHLQGYLELQAGAKSSTGQTPAAVEMLEASIRHERFRDEDVRVADAHSVQRAMTVADTERRVNIWRHGKTVQDVAGHSGYHIYECNFATGSATEIAAGSSQQSTAITHTINVWWKKGYMGYRWDRLETPQWVASPQLAIRPMP